jgi:hypothetical protein
MDTTDDAAILAHMRDVDWTLLHENLKLTPAQRLEKFVKFMRFMSELGRGHEGAQTGYRDRKSVSAEFEKLLPVLVRGGLEFIVVGGAAGIVHGSTRNVQCRSWLLAHRRKCSAARQRSEALRALRSTK